MKAGVYDDLSGEAYAAEKEWISTGRLKKLLPEHYRTTTPTDRTNLDFGIAFHTTILGAGEPVVPVVASSWRTDKAKTERESVYLSGGVPILSTDLPRLDAMRDSVEAHTEAHRLLYEAEGAPEVSVFAEVDGVPSKARFDRLLDSGGGIDLKTFSGKPSRHEIARAVMMWGYEIQQTHYTEVAEAAGIGLEWFKFVLVCKEPPHYVLVVELDEAWLTRGAALRDVALSRFLHPQFTDPYEGADGTLALDMPNYARV